MLRGESAHAPFRVAHATVAGDVRWSDLLHERRVQSTPSTRAQSRSETSSFARQIHSQFVALPTLRIRFCGARGPVQGFPTFVGASRP